MAFPFVGLIIVFGVSAVAWLAVLDWRKRKEAPHAKAAAIVGFVGVSAFLVLATLTFSKVTNSARMARERTACGANMRQIGKAFLLYMGDNNDRTPPKAWNGAITKYIDASYLACPLLAPVGYTMNEEIAGLEGAAFDSLARTVSVFDGIGGKDSVGSEDSIEFRHNGGATILYLDGHEKFVMPESFKGFSANE